MSDKELQTILSKEISGEVLTDNTSKTIYATDASAYRQFPMAVVLPTNYEDIRTIIKLAGKNNWSLIPRTAGTSIAGQVVGGGIVVDTSKHLNKILELNKEEKWVRVQPGVVLDELNMYLKDHGLFFGPETSTSTRCMIGGMVGNNSCGTHSLVYGSTRDHTLEIRGFLSDGSDAVFGKLTKEEFEQKCKLDSLEGEIYRNISKILSDKTNREKIQKEFPEPSLHRRNTGYALDLLLDAEPFTENGETFNFCKLLCGSEGTLMFSTEIKLNLVELPPSHKGLLVVHHNSIAESLKANLIALSHKPVAIELIDNYILECTKSSREHSKSRFFIVGEPGALLCIEFAEHSQEEVMKKANACIAAMKENNFGYAYPILFGSDISKVWALRKAGLGLLSNIPGDAKPQPVIEDTAVIPKYLPDYIADLNVVLEKNNMNCVYYAHISTGELHLRPVIDLKTHEGVDQFYTIALETAKLVKKYKGSISGEHGDGRLRGEFIPLMIGQENYELLIKIKKTWDPGGVLNPGKITDTPSMRTSLRFNPGNLTPEFDTILDFSDTLGIIRMAEKCNGTADCRKSAIIGGTMCPSYQASRDENTTTRARANMLREMLAKKNIANPFNNKDLYTILDLCLSCKGCKSECPSGVDMAKLKTEFLYQYYKSNKIPLRTLMIANFTKSQALASKVAGIYNAAIKSSVLAPLGKKIIGFAKDRSLPKVHSQTFWKWLNKNLEKTNSTCPPGAQEIYLFVDEFTNYNDTEIGITAVKLLNRLGYRIKILKNKESGRPYLSKGFLERARKFARFNVGLFASNVTEEKPLIGIEPSAVLSFRDEYPDLLRGIEKEKALRLASNTYTFEEFIAREADAGRIKGELFTRETKKIIFHGHCQQKAISTTAATKKMLTLPVNYSVEEIKSGCCGMAGSFGYEKEHFDLSMKIGELVLFPVVRKAEEETIIVAAGTSCRHQIKDGTAKKALHPVEALFLALA